MTAAAAKKQMFEPTDSSLASRERTNGLWIDESLLPTTLAKRGPAKNSFIAAVQSEIGGQSHMLDLADIVLGNPKGMPVIERRKRDRKLRK